MNNTPHALAAEQLYAFAIHPADVDRLWPVLEADLEAALEAQALGFDTAAMLKDRAREGGVLLVVINDEHQEHLVTVALEMIPVPDLQADGALLQACNVIACGGSQMDLWLGQMVDVVTQVAKEQGCSIICWRGRPGWARKMKAYNFEAHYTVMSRRIEP